MEQSADMTAIRIDMARPNGEFRGAWGIFGRMIGNALFQVYNRGCFAGIIQSP